MRRAGREEVWWDSSQTDDEVLMFGWRAGGLGRVRVVFSSLVMLLCFLVWIFNETAFKYYWLLESRLLLSKYAPLNLHFRGRNVLLRLSSLALAM